jgi:putative transposase
MARRFGGRGPRERQLELRRIPSGRGGWRPGSGRPRRRRGVPHTRRPPLIARHPVHVTLRIRPALPSLRGERAFARVKQSLLRGNERFGFRIVEFSVQRDHVHLVVEARDRRSLTRGVQGLSIRIAKAINRELGRHGKVFAERYHAHVLRSLAEVRNAVRYVHRNHHKHACERGCPEDPRFVDVRSSAAGEAEWYLAWMGEEVWAARVTARPRTWMLSRALSAPP